MQKGWLRAGILYPSDSSGTDPKYYTEVSSASKHWPASAWCWLLYSLLTFHLIDSWLMDINLLIHIQFPTVQHLFMPLPFQICLYQISAKTEINYSSVTQCTVTESSKCASTGSLSKHNLSLIHSSSNGHPVQIVYRKSFIRQTNYTCLCPHSVSISARQDLICSYWLC